MTLINYIYLPKSIQKINKGVSFLYKGVVLNGESHVLNEESALNVVVRYITWARYGEKIVMPNIT